MNSVYHRYVYLSRGQDQNCRCALELSLLQASLLAYLMLFVFGLSFLAGEHSMENQVGMSSSASCCGATDKIWVEEQ